MDFIHFLIFNYFNDYGLDLIMKSLEVKINDIVLNLNVKEL